jgi:hypothetical protein
MRATLTKFLADRLADWSGGGRIASVGAVLGGGAAPPSLHAKLVAVKLPPTDTGTRPLPVARPSKKSCRQRPIPKYSRRSSVTERRGDFCEAVVHRRAMPAFKGSRADGMSAGQGIGLALLTLSKSTYRQANCPEADSHDVSSRHRGLAISRRQRAAGGPASNLVIYFARESYILRTRTCGTSARLRASHLGDRS